MHTKVIRKSAGGVFIIIAIWNIWGMVMYGAGIASIIFTLLIIFAGIWLIFGKGKVW